MAELSESNFEFEEMLKDIHNRAGQLYRQLAQTGVRVFCVSLKGDGGHYNDSLWFHDQKSVSEWRKDIQNFLELDAEDPDGWANENVHNALNKHLRDLGYIEVGQVAADVFEGRISVQSAKLTHAPIEAQQPDGFGHYGWENRNTK